MMGIGFTVTVTNHGQWVRADGPESDPDWRVVDSNGHGHFYSATTRANRYPTLTWIAEPCSMGHGDDCDSEGHYECAVCGETVVPGTRPARDAWVPGHLSYHLTVPDGRGSREYALGQKEWDELQAAIREMIAERLAPFLTARTLVR